MRGEIRDATVADSLVCVGDGLDKDVVGGLKAVALEGGLTWVVAVEDSIGHEWFRIIMYNYTYMYLFHVCMYVFCAEEFC